MKPILIALLSFAGTATAATTPQTHLQSIAPGSTVSCTSDAHGDAPCKADGHPVEVFGCTGEALYGAIAPARGADLATQLVAGKGSATAHLQEGQFVCIAATARMKDTQRYYVVAVPTASVPGCTGNDLCTGHDKPVQWKDAATGEACHRLGKDGEYAGRCAAGWVDESELDQYANGL